METILAKTKLLSQLRNDYNNNQPKSQELLNSYYNKNPIPIVDLKYCGDDIESEYENIQNNISYNTQLFKCYLTNLPKYLPDYSFKPNTKIKYSESAAANCKNEFIRSVNKILNCKFEIYHIEKFLNQYKNRVLLSCCGGTSPFKFYCKKNQYRFTIIFIDDFEYNPGILLVTDLVNTETNEKYDFSCDLYHQYYSFSKLIDFLVLLESKNISDYINQRYSKFFELAKYLNNNGLQIQELKRPENLKNNQYILKIIDKNNKFCWMELYEPKGNQDYKLRFVKSQEFLNDSDIDPKIKYDPTNQLILPFDSQTNLDNLIEIIYLAIDYFYGNYGYIENGIYYNDKNYKKLIDQIKNSRNTNIQLHYYYDQNQKLYFDTFIQITIGYIKYNKNLDKKFPFEYYGIRFYYDGSDNCSIDIEAKYHYLEDKNQEIFPLTPIINLKGSFTELTQKITAFISDLYKYNPVIY